MTWKMQHCSNILLMIIMVHYRNVIFCVAALEVWSFLFFFFFCETLNSTESIWIYCKSVISWVFSFDVRRCRGICWAIFFKFSYSLQTAMTRNHPGGDTGCLEGDDTFFTTLKLYYLWRVILLKWFFPSGSCR